MSPQIKCYFGVIIVWYCYDTRFITRLWSSNICSVICLFCCSSPIQLRRYQSIVQRLCSVLYSNSTHAITFVKLCSFFECEVCHLYNLFSFLLFFFKILNISCIFEFHIFRLYTFGRYSVKDNTTLDKRHVINIRESNQALLFFSEFGVCLCLCVLYIALPYDNDSSIC